MAEDAVDTSDVEVQAREMGWVPKEEFRGDEAKWVDATTFVDRGQHVLPILKKTNEGLRTELTSVRVELDSLRAALEDSQKVIDALETHRAQDVKARVEGARANLKEQLIAAKEAGDHRAEVELEEKLRNLDDANVAAGGATDRAGADVATRTSGQLSQAELDKVLKHPDFVAFSEENSWVSDPVMLSIASGVATKLRIDGNKDIGKAFLDAVAKGTQEAVAKLSGGGRNRQDKVEGGGARGGNGSGKGKSYRDLPAEAKAACDDPFFVGKLVGPNRRYKTIDDKRAAFAKQYFEENQ